MGHFCELSWPQGSGKVKWWWLLGETSRLDTNAVDVGLFEQLVQLPMPGSLVVDRPPPSFAMLLIGSMDRQRLNLSLKTCLFAMRGSSGGWRIEAYCLYLLVGQVKVSFSRVRSLFKTFFELVVFSFSFLKSLLSFTPVNTSLLFCPHSTLDVTLSST